MYARKSTKDDDRQTLSIGDQKREMKEVVDKNKLNVIEVLEESRTAKEPGRPIFNKMIDDIEKGKANGICCWKLDRLARNPMDGGKIMWLLQEGKIKSIRTYDREYLPTDNVLMMSFEFGMSTQYVRDLSVGVKRGLRSKVAMGWKPGPAPQGYRNNSRKGKGANTIIVDKNRFSLLRKAWEEMMKGIYTLNDVKKKLDSWGFVTRKTKRKGNKPMSKAGLHRIFTNPFYYGQFGYPAGSDNLCPGKHKPMVTVEEYDKVQEILGKSGKPRGKKAENIFAYKSFIRCGECGCPITAEARERHNITNNKVRRYIHYHCTRTNSNIKCSQPVIQEEELKQQMLEVLKTIRIPDDFHEIILEGVKEYNNKEIYTETQILKSLQSQVLDNKEGMDNLSRQLIAKRFSEEEYDRFKRELKKEGKLINDKIQRVHDRSGERLELVEDTFIFAYYAKELFETGGIEEKQKVLQTFGSDFVLKDKKLVITVKKPFYVIQKNADYHDKRRRGDSNPRYGFNPV